MTPKVEEIQQAQVLPIVEEKNIEKAEISLIEDSKGDTTEWELNSPEEILSRYPLLKDLSEDELDKLNRRVRRRIDLRMLPTLTICLMINYLDRSNVTNARLAQEAAI